MLSFKKFLLLTCAILIGFIVPNVEASDIEILEINYNNNYESGDAVVIIESGKNASTSFKYSIFDDNDDFPDDWNQNNFNDSEWSNGETPFGNKNSPQGIEPRTINKDKFLFFKMFFKSSLK